MTRIFIDPFELTIAWNGQDLDVSMISVFQRVTIHRDFVLPVEKPNIAWHSPIVGDLSVSLELSFDSHDGSINDLSLYAQT